MNGPQCQAVKPLDSVTRLALAVRSPLALTVRLGSHRTGSRSTYR
jgi:hypothetical protein